MIRLCVVVLNYKTPEMTLDCLSSLEPQVDPIVDKVVVVDNASDDGSLDIIRSELYLRSWQEWVRILPSQTNGGFSSGNNLGIRSTEASYYLLLNSDTIVKEGAIGTLLSHLQESQGHGIAAPRLEWPDGKPQISCFRYRSPVNEFIHAAATGPITKLLSRYDIPLPVVDAPLEPEWVSFACVLIKKEVIDEVGFMDDGYFMYFDDLDYCRRVASKGWKILYVPEARVVHLRGGSGDVKTSFKLRKRPPQYYYASRSRYFAKFYSGRFGLLAANVFWLSGRLVSLMREVIGSRESHICPHTFKDNWTNWADPMRSYSSQGKNSIRG